MENKEEFFDKLEQDVEKLPKYYTKVTIGDASARVRKEEHYRLKKL